MEIKLTNPIQIGIITDNLENSVQHFENVFNIKPRAIAQFPPENQPDVKQVYHQTEGDSRALFCFFDFGNIEVEVIQPLSGKSIWQDFIDTRGPGIHHIKFAVPTHDETQSHLDSLGFSVSQMGAAIGANAGKEWVYYDTFNALGFDLEIMNQIIK